MMQILWLVLVMGYGFFTWAAGKFSKAALSFLNGGYLSFLCFVVLLDVIWGYINKKLVYNNKICPGCDTPLEVRESDGKNHFLYECPSCGYSIWLTEPKDNQTSN